MSTALLMVALDIVAAGICVLAFWKGGSAERCGAAAIALSWVFVTGIQAASRNSLPLVWILLADVVLSTCFLGLALRYSSIWLGAAMLFQGAEIGGHAAFLMKSISAPVYGMWLDLMSVFVLLAILGGTLVSWWKKTRSRPAI